MLNERKSKEKDLLLRMSFCWVGLSRLNDVKVGWNSIRSHLLWNSFRINQMEHKWKWTGSGNKRDLLCRGGHKILCMIRTVFGGISHIWVSCLQAQRRLGELKCFLSCSDSGLHFKGYENESNLSHALNHNICSLIFSFDCFHVFGSLTGLPHCSCIKSEL